jgi:hypothetical protein
VASLRKWRWSADKEKVNPRPRLILLAVVSSAALLVSAGPVSATHTSDYAADEIAGVVTQGQQDMNGVVSGYSSEISGLADEAAVADAENQALDAIELIWATTRSAIDELTGLYPGELGQVGGDAKQQLQDARQTARSTISDLTDSWTPPLPVTTTAPTITTPAPGAGPPDSTPGNGPPDLNPGNVPDSNPGSDPSPPPESGTETPEDANQGPDPAAPASSPVDGFGGEVARSSDISLELAALTPEQPFTVSPEAITSLLAAQDTGATATMAAMLDTVLSPAVVDLVLSPLLVLEILLRTLVDGGMRFIGPLTLFAVSAMALFAYDRRSRRNLISTRV